MLNGIRISTAVSSKGPCCCNVCTLQELTSCLQLVATLSYFCEFTKYMKEEHGVFRDSDRK
jgi:hypothetical protein